MHSERQVCLHPVKWLLVWLAMIPAAFMTSGILFTTASWCAEGSGALSAMVEHVVKMLMQLSMLPVGLSLMSVRGMQPPVAAAINSPFAALGWLALWRVMGRNQGTFLAPMVKWLVIWIGVIVLSLITTEIFFTLAFWCGESSALGAGSVGSILGLLMWVSLLPLGVPLMSSTHLPLPTTAALNAPVAALCWMGLWHLTPQWLTREPSIPSGIDSPRSLMQGMIVWMIATLIYVVVSGMLFTVSTWCSTAPGRGMRAVTMIIGGITWISLLPIGVPLMFVPHSLPPVAAALNSPFAALGWLMLWRSIQSRCVVKSC